MFLSGTDFDDLGKDGGEGVACDREDAVGGVWPTYSNITI